jgi:hypothetical protein
MPGLDNLITELESEGYTHLAGQCSRCERLVTRSFWLLRVRGWAAEDIKLVDLIRRIAPVRCGHCKIAIDPLTISPWRKEKVRDI